jgi:hypothetical protein
VILVHAKSTNTMKIQKIIGENGPVQQLCKGGGCPAAIIAADGNAYVQGYDLAKAERANLDAPAGESFVRIPLATLKKIAARVTNL